MVNSIEEAAIILEEYDEISNIEKLEDCISFQLYDAKYLIFLVNDSFPIIAIADDERNHPHFMISDVPIKGKNYRGVCLYDEGTFVEYIHTNEEKIRSTIDRLITLVNLPKPMIEAEFQKEFLYYWNMSCASNNRYSQINFQLFLDNEECFQWLEYQEYKFDVVRLTNSTRFFNDVDKKIKTHDVPVLYLPITDAHGILPPNRNQKWTAKDINNIINNVQAQKISEEAYHCISKLSFSHKNILLIFKLNNLFFGCIVEFKNKGTAKLHIKLESQIVDIIPVKINRCDFKFLNSQIGNSFSEKHIAIIGVGSLGSYIANELVLSGYKNLTIIDEDKIDYENLFRYRSSYLTNSWNKTTLTKYNCEHTHPEVNVRAFANSLSSKNYKDYITEEIDVIIFAVGNSDVQLKMNKSFIENNNKIPVFYCWLEVDGETSHVAAIHNTLDGCFECLYTDNDGTLCANTVNKVKTAEVSYIRNGCGGTRVPYGNITLLNATALLLFALNDLWDKNRLYSFQEKQIFVSDFPKNERCNRCAVRKQTEC